MATLTTIVRRTDTTKRWCLLHPSRALDYFTQDELDKVLTPFIEYAGRRPGIVPNSWLSAIDANTAIFSVDFDTVEHAEEAHTLLRQGSTVPVVKAKHDLLAARRKEHGLQYSIRTHVYS